jgi:hypothetical protein
MRRKIKPNDYESVLKEVQLTLESLFVLFRCYKYFLNKILQKIINENID